MKVGVEGEVRLGVRMGMRVGVDNGMVANECVAHSINPTGRKRAEAGGSGRKPAEADERFER